MRNENKIIALDKRLSDLEKDVAHIKRDIKNSDATIILHEASRKLDGNKK
jgi:hypothetical protein